MKSLTKQNLHRARGFTLIEILVVVFIIGLLASIVSINVISKIEQANIAKAKADISKLDGAVNMFKLDKHAFPTTDEGLEALVGDQIKSLPKDPWDRPYLYLSPGQNGAFDIYTLGADGQQGGEGENADIGNWDLN